jgi:hypothetical protein
VFHRSTMRSISLINKASRAYCQSIISKNNMAHIVLRKWRISATQSALTAFDSCAPRTYMPALPTLRARRIFSRGCATGWKRGSREMMIEPAVQCHAVL